MMLSNITVLEAIFMTHIRTAFSAEYSTLINFANTIFAEDFPALVPKLYRHHPEKALNHLLLLDENQIQAVLGAFPFQWQCGTSTLKAAGIGTVCVHPNARQLGYMSQLFDTIMPELNSHQFDFAFLGGQRQRYEPWGFTASGTNYRFQLTPDNARHFHGPVFTGHFQLAQQNDCYFPLALQLHNQQPCHMQRTIEMFWEISQTWRNQLFWIFDAQENWLGYLITNETGENIYEYCLMDAHQYVIILFAWLNSKKIAALTIDRLPFADVTFRELTTVAEKFEITQNTNLVIFNYLRVIAATLQAKALAMPLLNGTIVIKIADELPLAISIVDGLVAVSITNAEPELHFTHLEAVRLLFSPQFTQLTHPLLRSWAPLPLFISPIDNV